tara:strand:- start:323 stop:616 length:294 start_codon:yes stop_codon:yes gene_type:complete
MEYDLEANINPQLPDIIKVKIDTIEACIKIIESERDIKLKALDIMAEKDLPKVRDSTLNHYKDAIEIYVESLTELLRTIIDEAKGFKNDDTSPDSVI